MLVLDIEDVNSRVNSIRKEIRPLCKKLTIHLRWQKSIKDYDVALTNAKHLLIKAGVMGAWTSKFKRLRNTIMKFQNAPEWWAYAIVGTNELDVFTEEFERSWRIIGPKS